VFSFAVKFEKWKLMINDIADQWAAEHSGIPRYPEEVEQAT